MKSPPAIEKFLTHLRESLSRQEFAHLRLSAPLDPSNPVTCIDVRLIDLKSEPHLSFIAHEGRQDRTWNVPASEARKSIEAHLLHEFQNALLRTTRRDWQLHRPLSGRPRLASHRPSATSPPLRQHDAPKHDRFRSTATDWLGTLGVTHPNGRPKVSMADKYRQITRYTEILEHLAVGCGWDSPGSGGRRAERGTPPLTIVDMGCGKGYLTFAVWNLFHRRLQHEVRVMGIEARAELVRQANQAAGRIQAQGLTFVQGDIASSDLPPLDALIALHACNTATDDAIRRGIELGAHLLVVAPCCHQALRPLLGSPPPFTPLLRHGLLKERLAEWLTDGLRTLFLEWAGYRTKVIEFVASEHTPKNLMITAIQEREPFADASAKRRIVELKRFFQVEHHPLDALLDHRPQPGARGHELERR